MSQRVQGTAATRLATRVRVICTGTAGASRHLSCIILQRLPLGAQHMRVTGACTETDIQRLCDIAVWFPDCGRPAS